MTDIPRRLDGKIAVVNAAAQGIGRATAELLIAEGATVFASDLNGDLVSEIQGATTAQLDGTDPDAVRAYFAGFDRIDVLVHAVGYVHQGTIEECSLDAWRRSVSITLDSAFYVLQAAIPKMKTHGGSITTIASVVSAQKGMPRRCAYGATKSGVQGLTKSVAADYVSMGIRANAICPGTVDTPSLHQRMEELTDTYGSAEKAREFFMSRQPGGRFGTAEEIAKLCAFLASEDGEFINGQSIFIDGGITI